MKIWLTFISDKNHDHRFVTSDARYDKSTIKQVDRFQHLPIATATKVRTRI